MAEELRVALLGGLEISRGGVPAWGEKTEASALMNPRQALANLRRLLPSYLIITRQLFLQIAHRMRPRFSLDEDWKR